jgi:hypothetical protein
MKRLVILIITVCVVFQIARLEGYVAVRKGFETTAERETAEHASDVMDNAALTELQEWREHHGGDVDHAQLTGQVEKGQQRNTVERNVGFTQPEERRQQQGGVNNAAKTREEEKRQHIAEVSDNARFTSQNEQHNRYRSELNSSATAAIERDSRQPQR